MVDLSDIGQERRGILGRLLVTELELSAMNRPLHKRSDFWVVLDEVQEFVTPSLEDILSMGSEFKIRLLMAHQNMAQIPQGLRSSMLGNCSTVVSFRVGPDYAGLLWRHFGEAFDAKHFTQLAPYDVLAKVDADTFTMTTVPPEWEQEEHHQPDFSSEIIRRSRERYARPVAEVDAKWYQSAFVPDLEEHEPGGPCRRTAPQLNIHGDLDEADKKRLFGQIVDALKQAGGGEE